MKIPILLLSGSLVLASSGLAVSTGGAFAQDARVVPGTVAPDSPRVLPNGEVAPPPDRRVTGGVGLNQVPNDNAQTLTGGPSGGYGTKN